MLHIETVWWTFYRGFDKGKTNLHFNIQTRETINKILEFVFLTGKYG